MKEKVLKVMQDGNKPMRPGDIAKILGIESKEVSKAIKKLKEEEKVFVPKRCYYQAKI
jgi:Mn-dependent DtxR family transcriptional regulator